MGKPFAILLGKTAIELAQDNISMKAGDCSETSSILLQHAAALPWKDDFH